MMPLFSVLRAPLRGFDPPRRPLDPPRPAREGLAAGRRTALVLGLLALLFLLRVLGQIAVALFAPGFLPPMELWYSGLIPYPILLPLQLLILVFQTRVVASLWRGAGPGLGSRPRTGRFLRGFAVVYAAGMALRYALTMAFFPEQRWLGGAIPVCFHQVLALWLFVLGHRLGDESASAPAEVPA